MHIEKIISGGQTGVDRGALLGALAMQWPYGGWFPKGARCEDHADLKNLFPAMQEHESKHYPPRTACNVRDADATLIIYPGAEKLGPGTAMTFNFVKQYNRVLIDLPAYGNKSLSLVAQELLELLQENFMEKSLILNVAGPRSSKWPAGERLTQLLIQRTLAKL